MYRSKVVKVILVIFTLLLISSISLGCQHINRLPQPVEVEQGTSKTEMLNTLDEIMNKVSEENNLNILFVQDQKRKE